MSEKTENILKNWEEDSSYDYVIYEHMEETNVTYWCDVVFEGHHVWELMFDEKIEHNSPIDAVLSGVAAQAARGVEIAIARMFGLKDLRAIGCVLAPYYEPDYDEEKPEPITYEEFIKQYDEYAEDFFS